MPSPRWSQRLSRRTALTASAQVLAAVALSACGATATVSTSSQPAAAPTTASATSTTAPAATSSVSSAASTGTATATSTPTSASASTATPSNSASATASSTSTSAAAAAASSAAPTPTVNPNAVNVQSYGFTIGYVDALAQFSKQNPSIQTQLTTGPFPAKFLTLAAAGTPPDVLFVPSGGSVLSYASQQLLLPLDQYLQAEKVSSADFYTPAWNENLYQGKVYAITNEVDPNFALVYNKALFQQLGIAKPPATTQELDDANAKFYQSQGGTIKRLGILPPWLTYGTGNSLLTWFAVYGGGFLDPSDPKKLNVLQPADVTTMTWMKQYADHFGGYDSITKFVQSWGPSLIYKGYVSAFVNGQVAMGPMVSANYKSLLDAAKGGTYDGQFALALMPAGPNVKPDPSWLGGWGLGIPNGSKKVDQAWQVLAWMNASPDGTDLWAGLNNFLPGYKKSAFYSKNTGNPLVTGYQEVLAGAHLVPPALGSAPGDPAGDLLNAVVQGKSDVNTALTQYQQVVSAAYSKIDYQVPGAF